MAERLSSPIRAIKRTRLATSLLETVVAPQQALVTRYGILKGLLRIYQDTAGHKLFRKEPLGKVHVQRVIGNLIATRGLISDPDYGRNVYRVLSMGDATAEEAFALVTPFGYVSHLSAMQRWGLSDRHPVALHLTLPADAVARRMAMEQMGMDFPPPFDRLPVEAGVRLVNMVPPAKLRGRAVEVTKTAHPGAWLTVRGTATRLATIGQTFHDMLDRPDLCGGMAHVRDVWRDHAPTYLPEIIRVIEADGSPITKVRAGYLLDEALGLTGDARIQGWLAHAQRGGSRVLDPSQPFAPTYSEKWMLSINV